MAGLSSRQVKITAFYGISVLYFLTLELECSLCSQAIESKQKTPEGHLEPIFSHGPRHSVEVIKGFPSPEEFYNNYVIPGKPVLFQGGAMRSPAFKLWSEEYFLSYPESKDYDVTVETKKKENRTSPAQDMAFSSYLIKYKEKDVYMVNHVPDFLRQDVLIPPCLSCRDITNGNLIQDIMWYSSGGTKSVLHNDYAENIICVLRGTKKFFLVDKKHMENLNVTEKGFSDVDVERVDLDKYPGLYNLEHWHTMIQPGDCLYVPLLWVHQVTSFDSNIAVNIWWKNNVTVNFSSCDVNANISFKDVKFVGFEKVYEAQYKLIKNRIAHRIKQKGQLAFDDVVDVFQGQFVEPGTEFSDDMKQVIKKVFTVLDQYSADNIISMQDVDRLDDKDWEEIRLLLHELLKLIEEEFERETDEMEPGQSKDDVTRDEL